MFTGLVTEVGRVLSRRPSPGGGGLLRIAHGFGAGQLAQGESVAVDGACLTVVRQGPGWFEADLSSETLARTHLGSDAPGRRVNLERALRLRDRLGGHWVQGHVDGQGQVLRLRPAGEGVELSLSVPDDLAPYLVEKGSVAVDGVSLTAARLEAETVTIAVVPHTWRSTTLADRRAGDRVHLEADLVVRTVVTTLRRWRSGGKETGSLERALRDGGLLDHPGPSR